MRRRRRKNPYKKEMSDLAKSFGKHESVVLDEEYRFFKKPSKMPFPYGRGTRNSFQNRSINFDDWSGRRRWVHS